MRVLRGVVYMMESRGLNLGEEYKRTRGYYHISYGRSKMISRTGTS